MRPRTQCIELGSRLSIPILYEDRSVLAIDKPAGWMLAPDSWNKTGRNLHLALMSSLKAGDYWARSRQLKYVRFIHRLDAETSGVLLLAKSPGALRVYSRMFENRHVNKVYLGVVHGVPKTMEWSCQLKLIRHPVTIGKMKVDARRGKDAETRFRVLQSGQQTTLIAVRPLTGRSHQIRVHLAECGFPVVGDALYGNAPRSASENMLALRAAGLGYRDPFTRRAVQIDAPVADFVRRYGFDLNSATFDLGWGLP